MVSRAQRTRFSEWWWTVDKILLFGLVALMFGGIVLSLAALMASEFFLRRANVRASGLDA